MKTQRAFIFTVLIAVVVGVVLMLLAREPRYQGRSLISWLEQIHDPPWDEMQVLQAQDAVRAIGAKKALPKLLKLIKTKDDPVSRWIAVKSEEFKIGFFKWHSADDFQELGLAGFEALGTNAAPAVGALTKLLDEPGNTFIAFGCLACVGKSAEFALCRCITNQDVYVRQASVLKLASVTDDVEVYIGRIKGCLEDPSEFVRSAAVEGIGVQTSAPDLAVPLLVTALKDSSDHVSSSAAGSLADFGTNALSAVPALSNLVEHAGLNTANAALRTLVIIAPDESLPILTKCVARGRPSTGGALNVLVASAPDKALPLILAGTQSPNSSQRRVSFRLLYEYPLTPEIRSTIESATTDPDIIISQNAKKFLTEQYRKAHPPESQFPDEPVFQNKRLGEWLKSRRSLDGSFPENAVDAIHHMGTNAIPALIARLGYEEPPFGLRSPEAGAISIEAVCAFITLGEQAIPVLPQLRTLMESTNGDIALRAMLASCGTGSNATPFFINGLTSQFADVRNEAANYVAQNFNKQFLGQRDQLIPLFVKLLNDPDEFVRGNATNELKQIDREAAVKAGIK
jgi:HEAT repeat protein